MEATFHIHTKKYTLVNDATAIRSFEAQMKKGIFQCEIPPSFTELVTLLWALTRTNHKGLTLDALFEVVQPQDYKLVNDAVQPLLAAEQFGFEKPKANDKDEAAPSAGDARPFSAS
jgi:hypothetical protein